MLNRDALMSASETELLSELIGRRHACLRTLRELARQQLELIQAGELAHLLTLLGGKQRVLTDLQTTERALDPFRQQDPERRAWKSNDARQACARLAADCDSLLAEIVTEERQAEAEMARRRDETVQSLERSQASGAARGAYEAYAGAASGNLDLSSES
jgi:hypothetical protein